MTLTFTIEVQVERSEGMNVSRDAVAEAITDELDSANPGSVSVEDSEYEITDWTVSAVPEEKKRRP